MDSGKWIRELRGERFVKSSNIERISRSIAEVKGSLHCYVCHSTLADVDTGSIPSVHKLFSLAACLRISLEELLLVFGIDANEIRQLPGQGEPSQRGTAALEARESDFRFQLNFDTGFNSHETCYAVIGVKDDTVGDLIPPGSLIEVDVTQNAVQVFDWRSMRERPVYLVWHTDGHSCCSCQQEFKELTLLPYPLSRRPVRRFKVPREASVIGRVITAWLPFDQEPKGATH